MKNPRGFLLGAGLGFTLIVSLGSVSLWSQSKAHRAGTVQTTSPETNNKIAGQAERAFNAGNYKDAIKFYKELVKTAPRVAEIHSNLAVAYYLSGQFADAAHEARIALKLKPTLLNAHYFLGASLAESGYCKEALPYLEKDFSRVKDAKLRRIIGTDTLRCSMVLNHVDKAIDYDQILTREFPDDPEILYLTTHMFSDLSMRASQRLLGTSPSSYQVHRMNAEILELQGKPQDAIAEYRKVLKLDPHVPGIHYEIGKLLLQQSHDLATLHEAKKEFDAELQIDSGNAQAEYRLGEIDSTVRNWNDAITHLGKAVKLDPQMVPALVRLGEAYASAGRVKDAIAPLKRAIELDPNNVDAHYRLSFVYRRLGRNQEADQQLAAYKKAYEMVLKYKQRIRTGVVGDVTKSEAGTQDH
ncbi:MAG: tetratricopeptide repeat protein [Acidobacteriota bacterium]